jgi:hypothetical protein
MCESDILKQTSLLIVGYGGPIAEYGCSPLGLAPSWRFQLRQRAGARIQLRVSLLSAKASPYSSATPVAFIHEKETHCSIGFV